MPVNPNPKFKNSAELKRTIEDSRKAGRKVVLANGCFDLLHAGHIRYLEGAKAQGDILVLAVNSDESVRQLKGDGRPIQSEAERTEILASLECVDYVLVFDDPTVDGLLKDLKPDVHAKGTDYTVETVPERETVRSYGGRVAIVGDPKDHSSRDLIRTIVSKFRP